MTDTSCAVKVCNNIIKTLKAMLGLLPALIFKLTQYFQEYFQVLWSNNLWKRFNYTYQNSNKGNVSHFLQPIITSSSSVTAEVINITAILVGNIIVRSNNDWSEPFELVLSET